MGVENLQRKSTLSSGEIFVTQCSAIERKQTKAESRINNKETCGNQEIKDKDIKKGSPKYESENANEVKNQLTTRCHKTFKRIL